MLACFVSNKIIACASPIINLDITYHTNSTGPDAARFWTQYLGAIAMNTSSVALGTLIFPYMSPGLWPATLAAASGATCCCFIPVSCLHDESSNGEWLFPAVGFSGSVLTGFGSIFTRAAGYDWRCIDAMSFGLLSNMTVYIVPPLLLTMVAASLATVPFIVVVPTHMFSMVYPENDRHLVEENSQPPSQQMNRE